MHEYAPWASLTESLVNQSRRAELAPGQRQVALARPRLSSLHRPQEWTASAQLVLSACAGRASLESRLLPQFSCLDRISLYQALLSASDSLDVLLLSMVPCTIAPSR